MSPGFDQREIRGRVRLRAGVRLHVRVGGAEQLLGAIDRELLGDVDVLAAAVVALARIAFGVLVREHRALRLEHARARVVLGSDQLDVVFLALPLGVERRLELGIESGNLHIGGETCGDLRVEAGRGIVRRMPAGRISGQVAALDCAEPQRVRATCRSARRSAR